MPDRTALCALRVTVFTAVCVALGASGHWLESGRHPDPASIVLGIGLVLFTASRLAGQERSLTGIAATVLAIQAVLHAVFILPAMACWNPGLPAPGHGAGGPAGYLPGVVTGTTAQVGLGMSAEMALAHLVAGLAAAWWLRRGEAALWSLCHWLAVRAAGPLWLWLTVLGGGTSGPGPLPLPAWAGPRPRQSRMLRHTVVRRGPPRAAC